MKFNRFRSRSFFGIALAGVAAMVSSLPGQTAKPNILYIMCDDHAYQAISAYDSSRARTPNIDRLAREGMLFDRCYVTNALCGPSRATILTGKYSHKNGFYGNTNQFNGAQQTFPKILRANGYQTAMIGKWHLISNPTGFDYWNILSSSSFGGQGVYYNPVFDRGDTAAILRMRDTITGYVTGITTDTALSWISRRNPAKPFMLMLHYKAPHREWEPAPDKYHLYDNVTFPLPRTLFDDYSCRGSAAVFQKMEIGKDITRADIKLNDPAELNAAQKSAWDSAYNPVKADFNRRGWTFTDTLNRDLTIWKYQRYIQDYLRCIASVDDDVGRVMNYLKVNGLDSNTVVIYTSDQGFYMGEHGWFDKRFAYEQSLRTPLIVRWPGVTTKGSRNSDMVSNLDYSQTILDIAGIPAPADMQGKSFKPLLQGQHPADWRKYFYYHYYEMLANTHNVYRHYAVTDGRYKLIHFWDVDEWEFYDLKTDPDEMQNQYYVPQYASTIAQLRQKMDSLRTALGVPQDILLTSAPASITVPHCGMVGIEPGNGRDPSSSAARGGRSDLWLHATPAMIYYRIPGAALSAKVPVTIALSDIRGRVQRILVNELKGAGSYSLPLGKDQLAPGMYLCTMMTSAGYYASIPMIVTR